MLTMRKRFVIILGCVLLLFVASVILYPNTKNTLSLEEAKARLQDAYKMKIGMINIDGDGENEESFVKIAETSGEDVLELVDILSQAKEFRGSSLLIVPKHAIEFYDEHDVKIAKVMFSDEVHLEVGEDRFTLIDYDEHNLKKLVNSWYGEDVLVQS